MISLNQYRDELHIRDIKRNIQTVVGASELLDLIEFLREIKKDREEWYKIVEGANSAERNKEN